mmetsp:Transcript_12949/g.13022  ORF Transcript_12949/g.13022 Transcript_12949/m.13022 type:complete len:81 (-) Transcript_12949:92-334(-)
MWDCGTHPYVGVVEAQNTLSLCHLSTHNKSYLDYWGRMQGEKRKNMTRVIRYTPNELIRMKKSSEKERERKRKRKNEVFI